MRHPGHHDRGRGRAYEVEPTRFQYCRNKSASLFLGPARFANHDCGANARLMTTGKEGMEILALRDIEIGEEITVSYGKSDSLEVI
jgi:hypothetical protein